MGFFTDTSVCIGCKACEVACKEWNLVPDDGLRFSGESYDNTGSLGANSWRHVAFIEQTKPLPVDGGDGTSRWLMSSDVCKHCTHAACLDVCPTGALFRTEFGTVVVQQDVCNGCGYCVPACPFGVIDRRERDDVPVIRRGRGRNRHDHKCTLCYDRLKDGMEPACAQACPTESIQFGPLDELRERAQHRARATARAGRRRGGAVRRRPGGRRRRLRRLLPAARRAGGVRAAARPGRDNAAPARDLGRGASSAAPLCSARVLAAFVERETSDLAAQRRRPDGAGYRSYYGKPMIKAPVWIPTIPALLLRRRHGGRGRELALAARLSGNDSLARTAKLRRRRGDRPQPGAADRRPRAPGALPQHAAGLQGDIADERRHLGAVGVSGRESVSAATSRSLGRSRARSWPPRRAAPCSAPSCRPTRRRCWPTPPFPSGTRRGASYRSSSPAVAAASAGAACA